MYLLCYITFSPLIIVFVFVTFTLSPFDSNDPFKASNLPFRPSGILLINKCQVISISSFFEHPGLIFPYSASSTMANNKGLNKS